jgi:lysophospholipase L1-like esterase
MKKVKIGAIAGGVLAVLFASIFIFRLASADDPTFSSAPSRRAVIMIGDSLTYGTSNNADGRDGLDAVAAANGQLGLAGWNLINEGHGGFTAKDWTRNKNQCLTDALADARTTGATTAAIMLGTNDTFQGFSIDDYKNNMRDLVERLEAGGITTIILNGAPWIKKEETKNNVQLGDYWRALGEIAEKDSAVRLGFNAYPATENHDDYYISDGVHLTTTGYKVLGNGWAGALAKLPSAADATSSAKTGSFDFGGWLNDSRTWITAIVATGVAFTLGWFARRRAKERELPDLGKYGKI